MRIYRSPCSTRNIPPFRLTGVPPEVRHVPLCGYYNNLTLLGRLAKRQGVQESVQLRRSASHYPLLSLSFPPLQTTSNIVAATEGPASGAYLTSRKIGFE
jgi:hypothetical protein